MSGRKAKGAPAERRVLVIDREWVRERQEGRRFKWIKMDDGSWVCVWSAMVGDAFAVINASTRPGVFEELGPDQVSGLKAQIAMACHNDEPPLGERIFTDEKMDAISLLTPVEMNRILLAIAELNGTDPETVEKIQSFTRRNGGEPQRS